MDPYPPRPKSASLKVVETIRHYEANRKNIPTAEYSSVMEEADLSPIQVAYARRNRDLDPQLVWRGKDMLDWSDLVVHAPPIYIQEKVHPKALIEDLMRQSKRAQPAPAEDQPDLFGDFNGIPEGADKTDFYRHDANWSNRMILGDSLQVMASLAEREGLRGQVQCIYLDPPYGIKFNSNFQWSTTSRDVKDGKPDHITREPEMVKAFRDTWRDGIHSYLTYLRDRLTVARDLLSDSGSIFVQIGDENVHRVRSVLDEVFGNGNAQATIVVWKTSSQTADRLPTTCDFILWYAKDASNLKFRRLLLPKDPEDPDSGAAEYKSHWAGFGQYFTAKLAATKSQRGLKRFRPSPTTSQSGSENSRFPVPYNGREYLPGPGGWKTSPSGFERLAKADRLMARDKSISYVRFLEDFPVAPVSDLWTDVRWGFDASEKRYVVETNPRVVQRCILMATDPGDLVLDPTCGSGTTAFAAEQWGRRWITIDTSRVALALARARLMGARYPFYLLADSKDGQAKEAELTKTAPSTKETFGNVRHGFVYERVPHVTLKSIANNAEIDVIWDEFRKTLEPLRSRLNETLGKKWEEWEIPREPDPKWSETASQLHADWWEKRIARQREIDASIAARADTEYLYDKPYEDKRKVRVAGPFTVEALSPHRSVALDDESRLETSNLTTNHYPQTTNEREGFVEMVLDNLKTSGVQQAHKVDKIDFTSLVPWPGRYICAVSEYLEGDKPRRAGIFVGPEFGTVSRPDLVEAAREAGDADFDVVVSCAFSYDAHSSEFDKLGRIPILKARMNADLHMADDLKNTGKGNLFVIFGEPDITVVSGRWIVDSGGRLVANYEQVAELSGLGSLEEINRLGGSDLPSLKRLCAGRTVRPDESGPPGGRVGGIQHRGGGGSGVDGRVSPVPRDRERIAGGDGDALSDRASTGDAPHGGLGTDGGAGSGDREDAERAKALPAIQELTAASFPLSLTTTHYAQATIHGVDVFDPRTGEIRSDNADGIACWFIDTDYNGESFFVRHAYFLGANDPYKSLKTTLKAEIDEDAWSTLNRDTSRPFDKPTTGRIAVKVINHLGDEVMKVFRI